MIWLAILIAAALGYLLSGVNFAITTVRILKGEDVRNFGSGNAGLTNTLRCFGKVCALLTLIGDLGKGVAAVLLSQWLAELLTGNTADLYMIGCIAGIFAILGHVFPLYYGFKGGKGVLVGVSIFLVLDWRVFCVLIALFAAILLLSRYVSLASIIASACCPVLIVPAQIFLNDIHRQTFAPWQIALHFGLTAVMAGMIIFMHRSNIQRLREGTERKFGEKKERQG